MRQLLLITTLLMSFATFAGMEDLARQAAERTDAKMSMKDFAQEMKRAVETRLLVDIKLACSNQGQVTAQQYGITLDCEEAIKAAEDMNISKARIEQVLEELE